MHSPKPPCRKIIPPKSSLDVHRMRAIPQAVNLIFIIMIASSARGRNNHITTDPIRIYQNAIKEGQPHEHANLLLPTPLLKKCF